MKQDVFWLSVIVAAVIVFVLVVGTCVEDRLVVQ